MTTAVGDCVFPVITAVDEDNITGNSARIRWTTNEVSGTVVRWGEMTPPGTENTGADNVTSHEVTLTGLGECTVHYYEVESTDPAGNTALNDNGDGWFRFETLGNFGQGLQPCHAGQVEIDAPTFSCSDAVPFRVTDLDLNSDPLIAESTTLLVTSTTEIVAEPVIVTETGPNTSVFTGSIATAGGAPAPDGVLQVADGDLITTTYQDSDDGAGFPAVSYDIATADCAAAQVSGLRVTGVTQARATFEWSTSELADTVLEWGTTPALGNTDSASAFVADHSVMINKFDACGDVYFRVRGTDRYGNSFVADDHGQPFTFRAFGIPGLYVLEDFENGAPGWTLGDEWETGAPGGLGGSSGLADPSAAYNNDAVLGSDLSGLGAYPGDYEPSADVRARSPAYDSTAWTNTEVIVHRRLNVSSGDTATMLFIFGPQGIPFYRNDDEAVAESSWQVLSYDPSSVADGAPSFSIEFRVASNAAGQSSGWNIDDLIIKDGSLPDYAACGGCGAGPSFAGAVAAVDNNACGTNGVTVSWAGAVAWGSGSTGTYIVYRESTPGFTPSVGNRIATGVNALAYNDLTAPSDGTSYYLVVAENDETCSAGPSNGGVEDGNANYVGVSTTSSQPVPVAVEGVLVNPVASTLVRLSWPAVASATAYPIYRSTSPDPATFGVLSETSNATFDDIGEAANANTYYYLVRPLNACGQEGP